MARTPVTEYFGFELRRARESAGMSREEFGRLVSYAPSTVGAFETGERFPNPLLARKADEHLGTGDTFTVMYDKLLTGFVYPESFRPWVDYEQAATEIRTYECLVVPGLLQTEPYARALLVDEEKVAGRLARQAILDREDPPQLVFLLHEAALRQPVGGPEVIHQQLRGLVAAADRWIIQVVPLAAETYIRLEGPFVIATVDGTDMVYTSTQLRGYVLDGPEAAADARRRWDAIRSEALPRKQSRDLIMEVAESWKSQS